MTWVIAAAGKAIPLQAVTRRISIRRPSGRTDTFLTKFYKWLGINTPPGARRNNKERSGTCGQEEACIPRLLMLWPGEAGGRGGREVVRRWSESGGKVT